MLNPDGVYVKLWRDHIMTNIDNRGTRDNFKIISTEAVLGSELRPAYILLSNITKLRHWFLFARHSWDISDYVSVNNRKLIVYKWIHQGVLNACT